MFDPLDLPSAVLLSRINLRVDQDPHQRLAGLDRTQGATLPLPHHQSPIGAAADLDRLSDTPVTDRPHELPVKDHSAADVRADDQLTWIDLQQLPERSARDRRAAVVLGPDVGGRLVFVVLVIVGHGQAPS
ncbi:hypothetical protein GCM10009610_71030 [Pseudonocardia xinjiangensis]